MKIIDDWSNRIYFLHNWFLYKNHSFLLLHWTSFLLFLFFSKLINFDPICGLFYSAIFSFLSFFVMLFYSIFLWILDRYVTVTERIRKLLYSHAMEFLVRNGTDIRLRGKVTACVLANTETKIDHSNSKFKLQLVEQEEMLFSICLSFIGNFCSIVQL